MLKRLQEARKNEKGFTLIELLIVIVILGVLAGIVVFAVSGITDRGKTSACKAEVSTVATALEGYYAQNNAYPTAAQGLAVLKPGFLNDVPAATDVAWTAGTGQVAAGTTGPCAP
jgi:general secretion pathway protein G